MVIYSLNSAFEQSAQWGIKHYSISCFARGFKTSCNRDRNPHNIKILRVKVEELSLIFYENLKTFTTKIQN